MSNNCTVQADENVTNENDRLGLAFCRLNSWEWDEYIGEKPDGFDNLPIYDERQVSKYDYVNGPIDAIISIIGDANASWYLWKYEFGKTRSEWLKWYLHHETEQKLLKKAKKPIHEGCLPREIRAEKKGKQ